MPLDPFLEPFVASFPESPRVIEDFPAFREANRVSADALVDQLMDPPSEVRSIEDVAISVAGGEVVLRVYQPLTPGPHPIHLFMHGGAWMLGSVYDKVNENICRERAALADCVVVSVNYRKAPEHRFPTALNDCYAALIWVHQNAEAIEGRADLILVGGGSAGGNLAAALTLKVRDQGGPPIALQLLEVPALDLTWTYPSHEQFSGGYGLSAWDLKLARECYLDKDAEVTQPYVSPLWATDLSGLPPAHIMSAEYDMLRDEAAAYAQRLEAAGVDVTYSLQAGHIHISSAMTRAMPSARAWADEVIAVLLAYST